jgi:tetratricopeptide (TPR) repeat protein
MVRNGSWKFEFQWRKFYGGGVAMVAPDLRNMRSRKAFSIMGGPVASLVAGSIFTVATLTAAGHAWAPYWSLLSTLATFSIADFIVNLIPLKPESHYSDGAQLYQIVTNGPWARIHLAFAMVSTSAVSRIRPRDFDVKVINTAADFVPHDERGLLLRLFACLHYLDANRIPEAIASMQDAEALYEQSTFDKPQDICAEFVFVNALYKRDLAAAEVWWKRIGTLRKIDPDADYWRAKASLHWLKGEHEEARDAWERGNALAQKLPMAGTYDFTRSCFASLRAALDTPMQTTPPPFESLRSLSIPCETRVAVEAMPQLPMVAGALV